jgi:transcription elongation GreA/GreB family factor
MCNEEWFLSQLEEKNPPLDKMMGWLEEIHGTEGEGDAESLAELLQEALTEHARPEASMNVLRMRARWHKDDPAFRKACAVIIINCIGYSPENKAMLENCGFLADVPLLQCLKRLDLLRGLHEGILVYDKTWGFGVVREVDYFYKKVEIDFEQKREHQMTFAYAAETLEILEDQHLLAIRHRDPDRLQQLIEEEADEVIRIVIRSFGPQPIQSVQEILIPAVLKEEDWKPFWDRARKELKKDSLFDIPRKRNEPLRILETERGYNQAWFDELQQERDMKTIIRQVDEMVRAKDCPELTDEFKAALADRLAFVVKGAGSRQPGLAAHAVMLGRETQARSEELNPEARLRKLLVDKAFLRTVNDLPAKEIRRLLDHLCAVDREQAEAMLLRLIPQFEMSVLNDALPLLIELGREEDVAAIIRDLTKERQVADVEVLYWLYRHQDVLEKWGLGGIPDLARWMLRILNEEMSGEKLKVQNQIRDAFEKKDWLSDLIHAMDGAEAREFMRRIKDGVAWDSITRRSIMANLIKLRPDLQEIVAEDKDKQETTAARVTSRRSYYERQDQLEKITKVELPQVAKEIGVAREFGDLRENFEYKSAKDKQALLLRRQGELAAMLSQVAPTDFADVPTERVTQGTGVVLRYTNGIEEKYYILGEWDRDEELGIISSESRMAQTLMGHEPGDLVAVTDSESREQECEILAVEPLSPQIRQWIDMVKE